MIRTARTYWNLPLAERRAALRIVCIAGLVECLLRVWPLARITRALGVAWPHGPLGPMPIAARELSAGEWRTVRSARRVMRHWPFCKGTCLRESLVVGFVLRRHRPQLRLGVTPSAEGFAAHAWLEVGGGTYGAYDGYLSLESRPGPAT